MNGPNLHSFRTRKLRPRARLAIATGLQPPCQKLAQIFWRPDPQGSRRYVPLGANQHTQPRGTKSAESPLVGQVIAEVSDGNLRADFIQDGADCIALITTRRTHFDAAIELEQFHRRTLRNGEPAQDDLTANFRYCRFVQSAPMEGDGTGLAFSPLLQS